MFFFYSAFVHNSSTKLFFWQHELNHNFFFKNELSNRIHYSSTAKVLRTVAKSTFIPHGTCLRTCITVGFEAIPVSTRYHLRTRDMSNGISFCYPYSNSALPRLYDRGGIVDLMFTLLIAFELSQQDPTLTAERIACVTVPTGTNTTFHITWWLLTYSK